MSERLATKSAAFDCVMPPTNLGGIFVRATRYGDRVWVNVRFEGDLFDRAGDGFDAKGMSRRQVMCAIGHKARSMDVRS